ncbi:MAG: transporter substrate-binding domain-containing protein [Desulfococcaceae bacterium]|jgi:polar amino acid transport system substrate-binding protein|nr:transporter substrate-binding domain-containing protein [Desulfococcaceae bacterium]
MKNKMKNNALMFLFTLLLSFFIISAAHAESMVFVTGGMSPPLVYEEDGVLKGMDLDLITVFCRENGIVPEFSSYPWKRSLKNVMEGNAGGIFTLFRTEERESFLYYPAAPINIVKTMIWAQSKSLIRIKDPDDIKGKSIGVINGYKYGPVFDNLTDLNKTICNTKEQMIRMLANGRIDLAVDSETCFTFMCKKLELDFNTFSSVYNLAENPVYVAFSKKLGPRGAELAEKFTIFMHESEKNGKIAEIRNPYIK